MNNYFRTNILRIGVFLFFVFGALAQSNFVVKRKVVDHRQTVQSMAPVYFLFVQVKGSPVKTGEALQECNADDTLVKLADGGQSRTLIIKCKNDIWLQIVNVHFLGWDEAQ